MIHPSVAELMALVAGDPVSDEVRGHASACASCRRLAGLGDPVTARVQVDVITVDPALYHGREPLLGGGMGQALRAWDRRLGREIVIKQVGPLDDAAARARLQRRLEHEARVTARLDHPGIVTVHELGRWPDGDSFYTMPLVRGEPLDHAISACPSFAERLALLPRVAAVASAIAYAHDRGVVHRDLKPANVLCGDYGETVVIDWGLAKDLSVEGADARTTVPDDADPIGTGEAGANGELVGVDAEVPLAAATQRRLGLGGELLPLGDRPGADEDEARALPIEERQAVDGSKGTGEKGRQGPRQVVTTDQTLERRSPIGDRHARGHAGLVGHAPPLENSSSILPMKCSWVTPKRSLKLNLRSSFCQLRAARPLKVSTTPRPSMATAV